MSSRPAGEWPWPDRALGPSRAGFRPLLHEPRLLYGWTFLQDEVLVDPFGNELDVELLPPYYVRAILRHYREQAEATRALVACERLGRQVDSFLFETGTLRAVAGSMRRLGRGASTLSTSSSRRR